MMASRLLGDWGETMKRFGLGSIAIAAMLVACSSAEQGDTGDTDSGGADETSTSGTTMAPTTTAGGSMTGASASSTSASTSASSTGPDDGSSSEGGFINPESGDSGPSGPQPNGAQCGGNDDCESGYCYMIPMIGGVCSECLTDADCDFTCSLDAAAGYAVCSDGSTGVMCESTEGCADGLVCAELIDTGGLFNASFCSECATDMDCDGGQLCSPYYDTRMLGGYFACVDPMSVPDGQGCPIVDGMGDGTVCLNGHCGIADLFGVVELGLCGECTTEMDCAEGETCMPAMAGMGGVSGPTCG
jgi:hypothetical protein